MDCVSAKALRVVDNQAGCVPAHVGGKCPARQDRSGPTKAPASRNDFGSRGPELPCRGDLQRQLLVRDMLGRKDEKPGRLLGVRDNVVLGPPKPGKPPATGNH